MILQINGNSLAAIFHNDAWRCNIHLTMLVFFTCHVKLTFYYPVHIICFYLASKSYRCTSWMEGTKVVNCDFGDRERRVMLHWMLYPIAEAEVEVDVGHIDAIGYNQ